MFGIKTRFVKTLKKIVLHYGSGRLYSKNNTSMLMDFFNSDDYGHKSDKVAGDLGYGWMHYSLVRLTKPKKILCVGSRYGYIPGILAQACKDNNFGSLDFVDAAYGESDENGWTGVGYWKKKENKDSFKKFGLEKFIKIHVMTTKAFAKKFPSKKYQYVYIDGDHSYQGVALDYKLFWPKLEIGGFMAFHDICVNGKKPEGVYGVHKLWTELIKSRSTISFDFEGSGLGIIQKNK